MNTNLTHLAEMAKTFESLNLKADQIAFCCKKELIPSMKAILALFGAPTWIQDRVVAPGTVGGKPATTIGDLNFNYEFMKDKLEFEILNYDEGTPNWHAERALREGVELPDIFLSHIGFHTQDAQRVKDTFEKMGLELIQEVRTASHENQYLIDKKRTFWYQIWNTRDIWGFDTKIIYRIEP